jgi:hypothetical protein
MFILLLVAAALAGTTVEALQADLDKWQSTLKQHATYQIDWSELELERLAAGEIVKRRSKMEGADRVFGAVWAPTPLRETWVAVQDEQHWPLVDGLVEERLSSSTFQNKILYQRIRAPWPFKDRQWIIHIVNNLPLLEASGHEVIERTWKLSGQRGAKLEVDDGIWIDVNDGGWFALEAGGGSLLVYHVRAVIGGSIPDDAAAQWTMITLGSMMRGLLDRSEGMRAHYGSDHLPIRWPDGKDVPAFDK